MNLTIELPQQDPREHISQTLDTLRRLMACADVAKDVFVIAPKSNVHWKHWEESFTQNDFRTTEHRWCGMGVSDPDSGKLVGHHTRISANRHLLSHQCRCGSPREHIHSLRMEKTSEEQSSGKDHHTNMLFEVGPRKCFILWS